MTRAVVAATYVVVAAMLAVMVEVAMLVVLLEVEMLVVEVDVFKQIKGRKYELCENLSNDDFDLDLREDKPVN